MDAEFPARTLVAALNPVVRDSVKRRVSAMRREFNYLVERQDSRLLYLRSKGWNDDRVVLLFVLNSVYQLAIGPLHSAARQNVGLGGEIPIKHGADTFGFARAARVNELYSDFASLVAKLEIEPAWLSLNTCADVLYRVARFEAEDESGEWEP